MELFRDALTSLSDVSARVDDEDGDVIKGAIDYILLPLLILAVSGPLFVVMYIVMAAVEFRLPPNDQEGRSTNDNAFSQFSQAAVKFLQSGFQNDFNR